ncbi:MAG: hypothetical protein GC138_06120 [Gammaproteobacteria bacterium]|nr:hypothetical protein [Gammaproteobacteria bacterium]
MKKQFRPYRPLIPVVLALTAWSGTALAAHDDIGIADLRMTLPAVTTTDASHQAAPLWLAANGSEMNSAGSAGDKAKGNWSEPMFTGNKLHKYLGIGSLLLAGLTAMTAPDSEGGTSGQAPSGKDLHQSLAYGATALGVGAVATGFAYHFDDIHMENGITDVDNLHMILGLLGTAGYAAAVADRPKSPNWSSGSHSTYGIVGAVSMAVAIKLEW